MNLASILFHQQKEFSSSKTYRTRYDEVKALPSIEKTVDTPFFTMFHTKVFDVVTPYMHFTIHYPSYFYKKVTKKHV